MHMHVMIATGGIFALLLLASMVIYLMQRRRPEKDYQELRLRLKSWWVMAIVFCAALLVHRTVSIVFLAFLSFLAFKEYLSLIPTRDTDRRVLFWAYLAIPLQFYWIYIDWYGMAILFIPVYMFLLLPIRAVLHGETEGFLRAMGTLNWGLMITVFSLSHIALLLILPDQRNPNGGGVALVIFLVFLTEANDIFQYLWGKLLGRRKVVPKVSPNKTWGGLLGGIVSTVTLSIMLSHWLTPLSIQSAIVVGLMIAVGGFFGDVVISSLKRDLKIKDSGSLLPGHGGILDRVDSLSYTAPLFFHFVHYFYY